MLTGHITGDKALQKRLEQIRRGLRRATRKATNKSLTVVRKAVVTEAPVGRTRRLRKDIGKRLNKSGQSMEISGKVGPNVAKRKLNRDGSKTNRAPHGHLNVLGTVARFTKRGARRGSMPQNDFVTRGFVKSQSSAASTMKSSLQADLRDM